MKSCAFLLFVCAGVLLSGGVMLSATTTYGLVRVSYYFWTSDLGVELGSFVLVIGAGLLCLPTCWLTALLPYHPRSLTVQVALMCLMLCTTLLMSTGLLSVAGLSRALRDATAVNASMMRALGKAYDKPTDTSFTAMQLSLECCGVHSYRDWYQFRPKLPSSCCGQVPSFRNADHCSVPLYHGGCLEPALLELRYFCNSTSVLAYCLVLALTTTMFATAYTLMKSFHERNVTPGNKQVAPIRVACLAPDNMNFAGLTSPVMMPQQLLPPSPLSSAPTM